MYRLGIIGLSEGNGHPYSWSAICNGYDDVAMAKCPYPAIPEYLRAHIYPDQFIATARVTHIWCDDLGAAQQIAKASRIDHYVDRPEQMIGQVDGVLLARDDAENHLRLAKPFLASGVPVFIDKPLAVSRKDARAILECGTDSALLFSCTALRYANELQLSPTDLAAIGKPRFIDAWVPKHWETYAIHVIEPLVAQIEAMDEISSFDVHRTGDKTALTISWRSGLQTRFTSSGSIPSPIGFRIEGSKGYREKQFHDSFAAFKAAIERFIGVAFENEANIPRQETLKVIEIIELGRSHGAPECSE